MKLSPGGTLLLDGTMYGGNRSPAPGSVWGAGRDMGSALRLPLQWEWSLGDFKPACRGQWGQPSGKGTKQNMARTGRGRGRVQSTTDNSTLERRPQTETKDGLLLRGACETKTMHAKKVYGKWRGRRGRTTHQKTSSGGKPVLAPPSTPTLSAPRTCESSGEEELFEGTSRQRRLLLPKGLSGEKKLSAEP